MPVAFGTGSALYLSLRFEPDWIMVLGGLTLVAILYGLTLRNARLHAFSTLMLMVLLIGLGAGLCKLRAERVCAPVLADAGRPYRLDAVVIDVVGTDISEPKLLLAPLRIRGVAPDKTPIRIRLGLRKLPEEIAPGQAISVLAILHPPAGPSLPGGYDYARSAWFDAVGAVGFAPGRLDVIERPAIPAALEGMVAVNRWRWAVTQEVRSGTAQADMGGFAAALVTGHQAYLTPELVADMRDSGLAHILSISGLHMAIVGGFAFFLCRALLALIPFLALRYPIKKWAAGFGIVTVAAYLVLSGAPSPAIRAAVVAWVAFGAILFDRRALSLRALALAAFVVLLIMPEAVLEPGFQMSFCATAALLALAEVTRNPVRELSVPMWVRLWQGGVHWLKVSLLASGVAGLATAPFGVFYFNRAQTYGLLANLLEAPLSGFVVMPALAVGTVLNAGPLLWLAGAGLSITARIAAFVSDLPGAVMAVASPPGFVLCLSMGGVLWMCLMRGTLRWIGLLPALAVFGWPRSAPPDIWLDNSGGNAVIRVQDDAYALRPRVKAYGVQQFAKHYALDLNDTRLTQDYVCKSYVCTPTASVPFRVGFTFGLKPPKPAQLEALCHASDLVVIRARISEWPQACVMTNRITADDFERLGAMELRRKTSGGWDITASEPLRGHRPWTLRL